MRLLDSILCRAEGGDSVVIYQKDLITYSIFFLVNVALIKTNCLQHPAHQAVAVADFDMHFGAIRSLALQSQAASSPVDAMRFDYQGRLLP